MAYFVIEDPVITNMERTGSPCGNAGDPDCWCDRCGKEIYSGEGRYDDGEQFLCEDCVRSFWVRSGGDPDGEV